VRHLKTIKLILVLLIVIVASCLTKQEGKKLVSTSKNIPKDAFFVKGKNVGYWCKAEVHDHKNNAIITIYDGVTVKLLQSKRFSVICKLEGNPLWINDLKNQIDYFDGEVFHFKRLPGQDSCWLQ